ncbi:hypothetical protein SS50377_23719 [Spironucleus salmonicida]|uniref:Uncharacterized protein n=1 Tax=Spironucleus salmonicida TaxID=348837 RepID=V6LQ74_9EUKA|nr:hypothetical protein SS50377_23719 [Spironucleus salmonicida]|eukprot:EST46398.1 Hypothetical protein SS50377_13482 [Spironucleus salmonicida]
MNIHVIDQIREQQHERIVQIARHYSEKPSAALIKLVDDLLNIQNLEIPQVNSHIQGFVDIERKNLQIQIEKEQADNMKSGIEAELKKIQRLCQKYRVQ